MPGTRRTIIFLLCFFGRKKTDEDINNIPDIDNRDNQFININYINYINFINYINYRMVSCLL